VKSAYDRGNISMSDELMEAIIEARCNELLVKPDKLLKPSKPKEGPNLVALTATMHQVPYGLSTSQEKRER
jgi:hypothetical protein